MTAAKITTAARATIVAYIADNTQYDAETVRISADGEVTAILDANKTFSGPHASRHRVGDARELLRDIARLESLA